MGHSPGNDHYLLDLEIRSILMTFSRSRGLVSRIFQKSQGSLIRRLKDTGSLPSIAFSFSLRDDKKNTDLRLIIAK